MPSLPEEDEEVVDLLGFTEGFGVGFLVGAKLIVGEGEGLRRVIK